MKNAFSSICFIFIKERIFLNHNFWLHLNPNQETTFIHQAIIQSMEFKTDAKTNYTLIQPEQGSLNEKMAAALRQKVDSLIKEGFQNFIIDLKNQQKIELEADSILIEMHHQLYENEHSLVFINLQEAVLQSMKKEQLHLSLNLSPTLIEAIDIISMEILERDILNES